MNTPIKRVWYALGLWAGAVSGAPITFNTALPVHDGGWVLREQYIYMKADDDPSASRRDMRVAGLLSMLGNGVTRELALFGVAPWLDKRLDMSTTGQDVTRSAQGLGDIMLMARYTAFEQNAPARTFRVAPFFGVEAPTGDDEAKDDAGRLPSTVQVGSGSWDAFGGLVLTYQTLGFQVDGQASYRANGEANGFEAGEVFQADGSLQHRLYPRRLAGGVPAFLYGVIEANFIHGRKDRVDGAVDPDSGGTSLFLSPGLQFVTKKWLVEGGAQFPVLQDLNGAALQTNYGLNLGIRINF